MADLLYLVHRMPYPPDKGDKVRSFNLLKHLSARHSVHLGCFMDDPEDEAHVATLRGLCASLHVARLEPRRSRVASLRGLLRHEALSLPYYRDAALQSWVDQTLAQRDIAAAVVFSSPMGQYVAGRGGPPLLVDFVDVDSAKWGEYAAQHRWPLSWLYRRESRRLLAYERELALGCKQGFFATNKEAELFTRLAPETASRVTAMNNGVDAEFFAPAPQRQSPFAPGEAALVFTGAMDYWPNVDAVTWFVQEVLPRLHQSRPALRFHIVGRNPTPAVRALAGSQVVVTGTVPDVRPYLQHAAVVVAPLRLARGIQNKILEAMAMARPVVAATACVDALTAETGAEILAASEADDYARCILLLLQAPDRAAAIGTAGRLRVLHSYTWAAHMAILDPFLSLAAEPQPMPHARAASRRGAQA